MVRVDLTNSEAFSLHVCLQVLLNQFPYLDPDGHLYHLDLFLSESLTKELKSDA